MKYYTGIGSRKTPESVIQHMKDLGFKLAMKGIHGRSGSACGADAAFEEGFILSLSHNNTNDCGFTGYLPWAGFNNIPPESKFHKVAPKFYNYGKAVAIAETLHPIFNKLSHGARALHTRNVYQVLGDDLETPSDFLICYAEPNPYKSDEVLGGTNTAWKLAKQNGIPCYNLCFKDQCEQVNKLIEGL